jgi:hypothetical protein
MNYVAIALLVLTLAFGVDDYFSRQANKKLIVNEGIFKTQLIELGNTIKTKDKDIDLANSKIDELKKNR